MISVRSLSAALALLIVASAGLVSGGEELNKFSGGLTSVAITFPEDGGSNSSVSIELPRHSLVNSAYIDLEGKPKSFGSYLGFLDFSIGTDAFAYDGSTTTVPPKSKPINMEGQNITTDRGLKSSDNSRVASKAPSAVPYHLFEFDVGDIQLSNFYFTWEGYGVVYPDNADDPYTAMEIYVYHCATETWKKTDSYYYKGDPKPDYVLHAGVSSGAQDYPDSRGRLCFLAVVTPPVSGSYTSYMETDYVSLEFNGTKMLYPENLKLDLKGDGTVEWQRSGRLKGMVNFTGNVFTNALQAILDASPPGNVKIPLKFTSEKGGILVVSNLSIEYTLKNLPPEAKGTPPAYNINEDENVTALIDLWNWFKDDAGVENLSFSIIYESDSTKLHAAINSDGHHVDVFTMTENWYGTQRFRVRATDIESLSAQLDFTVNVLPVNDPPRLRGSVTLTAYQGVRFEHVFSATDADLGIDPVETLSFSTNTSLFTLDPETGLATFTPSNSDVGIHYFSVTVTDAYGASDTRNGSLRVENVNDPPSIVRVPDQTATEDQPFELILTVTDPDLSIGMDELVFEDSTPLFDVSQDGRIAFTPTNKEVGIHSVSVSVTDIGGLKAWANFTITVVNVNDPPRLEQIPDQTVEEEGELLLRAIASDEDRDDVLKFSTSDPLVKINSTGWISYRPTQKEVGVHQVRVTVTDAAGESATVTFNITVLNVNDPPRMVRILSPPTRAVFKQGEEINFTGDALDEDGDELSFSWYLDSELIGTGAFFRTSGLKPGTYNVTLKVDDGSGPVASDPVQITVVKKQKPVQSTPGGPLPGFDTVLVALALLAALVGWRAAGCKE
ncbi:MAG: tandem-95 repeat protein [Thermoplasmata archaeon]